MNAGLAVRFHMLLAADMLLLAPSAARANCVSGTDTDGVDNCAFNSMASQADADGDGEGNACDAVFGFRSEVGLNVYQAPFA